MSIIYVYIRERDLLQGLAPTILEAGKSHSVPSASRKPRRASDGIKSEPEGLMTRGTSSNSQSEGHRR